MLPTEPPTSGVDLTPEDFHEIAATYHGMLSRLDDQLGRLLGTVERIGATDAKTVGTLTDLGSIRGLLQLHKWPTRLDPCLLRNPLFLAGWRTAEGREVDETVEMVDLRRR